MQQEREAVERRSARAREIDRVFRLLLAVSLAVSAGLYVVWSRPWPLVGDASLMHYIVFLMERGWAPYRDLGDMNMPGSFLIERAAMQVFGAGAAGWRVFDFALLVAAGAAFFVITKRAERSGGWLAGLFAACLFALVHGRDGLAQGGQRDLTMAVCLIAATAMLFVAVRRAGASSAAAGFGLLSGIAFTVKPTAVGLTVVELAMAALVLRGFLAVYAGRGRESAGRVVWARLVAPALVGWFAAPVAAVIFLRREGALEAFWTALHGMVPYYAGLGRRPLGYVLGHSLSPVHALVAMWVVVLVLGTRSWRWQWMRDWERSVLVVGVVWGLINCVVQGRALPYYRYPLLAFLLPLMAMDLVRGMDEGLAAGGSAQALRGRAARWLAVAALAVGGFFLAPQSAVMVHRYRWWETDFIASLESRLAALGGPGLNRRVQCIDTNSGCGNVLYRMRLESATGLLSDFFVFGDARQPVVEQERERFEREVRSNPPEVMVVTSNLYLDTVGDYGKLDRWPELKEMLASMYRLDEEWTPARTNRWWNREEMPAGFRVYVLRGQ